MTDQEPAYRYAPPHAAVQPRMPGTVLAATIVTYTCAGVWVAMTMVVALFAVFIGRFALPNFDRASGAELAGVVISGILVSLACCALACWLAWQTGRRKPWARFGLAGLSGLTAAVSLLTLSPPTVVSLMGAVTVLVLLFVPETGAWFRDA